MRISEKIITAACRTADGFEWTSLKLRPEGPEPCGQGRLPLFIDAIALEGEAPESDPADTAVAETLKGDLSVAMPTSELLLRTVRFPTADRGEIASMVGFQVDKASPFPLDQLAVAHEVLESGEEEALVLMAAAKRERIDAIGEAFGRKGVHIHSIDVRVLGWLRLMRDQALLQAEGCAVMVIDDGMELELVVLRDGRPLAIRSLQSHLGDADVVDELTQDIAYTLTVLDTEYDLSAPASFQLWSFGGVPSTLQAKLSAKTGLRVETQDLAILPSLSEGIVRRAQDTGNRIELIPQEWIDLQKWQQLRRKYAFISAGIAGTWLVVSLVFFTIFQIRNLQLESVRKQAATIAPKARQALENRQKLKALKIYTDRSDSALECLRETTRLLPFGDIEFVTFNYTKGKGVSLRGTAESDDLVYNYFEALTGSKLFTRLKDQSVNTKATKEGRRSVFSVTLDLPAVEEES